MCVCVCEREREGDREIERQETDVCPVTEGQGEKGCKQSPVRSGESISPALTHRYCVCVFVCVRVCVCMCV